jgi:DNA-binding SARP family transcriptional activator/tetratricopeptide (TPR) repeat protein
MRYHVLGGLAVTNGDRALDLSTPKQRAVLAVLLLERDRVVSVDRLIDLLWGDEADKALSSLQAYVSRLRATLEPERKPRDPAAVLLSQPPGYRLAVDRSQIDMCEFEDAVVVGLDVLRTGVHADAVAALDAALKLWTGPLLPEFAHEPFVLAAADRVEGIRVSAVEALAEARLELGDHHGVIGLLEPEVSTHPTLERLHGLLALALYRGGRQADALRVVDRCRRALVDSAGLDLGPDLRRLETELLAQAPSLDFQVAVSEPAAPQGTTTKSVPRLQPDVIGRAYEVDVLDQALAALRGDRGGVVVLIGEPGIGKTRLAEWMRDTARTYGIGVAWSRCPESRSAPPYWPITNIAHELRVAGALAVDFVRLDWNTERAVNQRFGLYQAVLRELAVIKQPFVFVIDDLQWADPDTLRLLEHIAGDLHAAGALLVVTTRPLTDSSTPALIDCLSEFARVPGVVQLSLSGLLIDDVAGWLEARHDTFVPHEIAALVHSRTGGNPLFVKELTELLASEGRLEDVAAARSTRAIPAGVHFVVRRRVSRLPAPSQQLLAVAAVVGPMFRLDSLAAASSKESLVVLDALAPALDAGLIVESGGGFAFSHALVADALASEVNAVRRAAIHAAVARAFAVEAGPGFGLHAAAIAHHALEGILAGTGDLAIEASTRAAQVAAARFANEDAAAHWGGVADAFARSRPSDAPGRINALIEQAAALTRADMVGAAKPLILDAVEAAAAAGMTDAMARAALLLNQTHPWTNEGYGIVDNRVVHALKGTIELLGDGSPGDRALLMGALASELVFADRATHDEACRSAEAAARQAGNPLVLAKVLNNIMMPNRPSTWDERFARVNELLSIVDQHDAPNDLVYVAHQHLAVCHMEVGEFDLATQAEDRGKRALAGLPSSYLVGQQSWFAAAIAGPTGRYEEAERLGRRAVELHRGSRQYDIDALSGAGALALAIDQGGLEELLPSIATTAAATSYRRVVTEALAFALLELGRTDEARVLVAPFNAGVGFPDDWVTLFCASAALHVRVELGDAEGVAAAEVPLRDYPHHWVSAGMTPLSMGFVALALARCAAFHGDPDRARSLFAEAAERTERVGAWAWLARGLVHEGAFLRESGDSSAADKTLARARDIATVRGFPYVIRRLDALRS